MDDLTDLIMGLAKEAKREAWERKKEAAKKLLTTPVESEKGIRIARLSDKRWVDEAIVMLVTESRCTCGANFEHPHSHLFIRRYHPVWGVHFEALGVRPVATTKPYRVERRILEIQYCHRCLTQTDVREMQRQLTFTFDSEECA